MSHMKKLALSLVLLASAGGVQSHLNAADQQSPVAQTTTTQQGYYQTQTQMPVQNSATTNPGYQDPSKTYNLSGPNTPTNAYPQGSTYSNYQQSTNALPPPLYGYGYYSLPPPTPSQAFPDKAQSDALYEQIKNR